MTGQPCPFGRAWCREHEIDGDDTHICQGRETELPSGWFVAVKDFHEGAGPELALDDPDCRLSSALINRLSLTDAWDLMIALAEKLRDAHSQPQHEHAGAGR